MSPASVPALLRVAVAAALLSQPVHFAAAQDRKDLDQLERRIQSERKHRDELQEQRRALEREVKELRREMIRTARATQEHEALLNQLESKIAELEKEGAAQMKALAARRSQMSGTLAALQRLSRNPPQALLLSGAEPVTVVRNALLLRAAVPQLRGRAEALRGDLERIAGIRREIERRRESAGKAARELDERRDRMNALLTHKASLRQRMADEVRTVDRKLANLDRRARSLRELFANLERRRRAEEPAPHPAPRPATRRPSAPAPEPSPLRGTAPPEGLKINPVRGGMTLPAQGRVVEDFGENTGLGNTAKGATFHTRAGAQVVAPFDGKVVFAGPFRGYAQILIIEHGDAYHTLLAGLKRVDVRLGQWLLAGEPVGIMGSEEAGSRLYVELRRKGQPVNPLPWFAAANDKVRG